MARLIERIFDPNRPVTVRRFFVAAGRHWEPGRAFPWKNMAIAQRRVKLLFEAGKLMHPDAAEPDATEVLMPDGAATQPTAPSIAQEGQNDEAHHSTVAATATVTTAAEDEPASPAEPVDDLDAMTMPELRAVAEQEGAPTRVSRAAQREAIRGHRLAGKTE